MGARVFALWKTKHTRRVFSQLPPPTPPPQPLCPRRKNQPSSRAAKPTHSLQSYQTQQPGRSQYDRGRKNGGGAGPPQSQTWLALQAAGSRALIQYEWAPSPPTPTTASPPLSPSHTHTPTHISELALSQPVSPPPPHHRVFPLPLHQLSPNPYFVIRCTWFSFSPDLIWQQMPIPPLSLSADPADYSVEEGLDRAGLGLKVPFYWLEFGGCYVPRCSSSSPNALFPFFVFILWELIKVQFVAIWSGIVIGSQLRSQRGSTLCLIFTQTRTHTLTHLVFAKWSENKTASSRRQVTHRWQTEK